MSDDFKSRAANDGEPTNTPINTEIPIRPPTANRRSTGTDGEEGAGTGKRSKITAAARASASAIIQEIGQEFVLLRKKGRNAAWADLEDKIMTNGHILVTTGLISAKDWIGMAIDIEQFRKADSGGDEMPGDKLAEWLTGAEVLN